MVAVCSVHNTAWARPIIQCNRSSTYMGVMVSPWDSLHGLVEWDAQVGWLGVHGNSTNNVGHTLLFVRWSCWSHPSI